MLPGITFKMGFAAPAHFEGDPLRGCTKGYPQEVKPSWGALPNRLVGFDVIPPCGELGGEMCVLEPREVIPSREALSIGLLGMDV